MEGKRKVVGKGKVADKDENKKEKKEEKNDSEYIKRLYKARWKIETHQRVIEHELNLLRVTSKTLINVKQDVDAHQTITLLAGYMNAISTSYMNHYLKSV